MTIRKIQQATVNDTHFPDLKTYVIEGCLSSRTDVKQDISLYLTNRDKLTVTDGVNMKGRCIITQKGYCLKALEQIQSNHIAIGKKHYHWHEFLYTG